MLGIIGGALFYGDAVITPAISVLSAVEGLKLVDAGARALRGAAHRRDPVGLFAVQSRGTARVAAFFGPVMLVWFVALAVAGLRHISRRSGRPAAPSIRSTACSFLVEHGMIGLVTLGAVFLAVTGGRRSTPISAISAASRSRPPGSASCCPRW